MARPVLIALSLWLAIGLLACGGTQTSQRASNDKGVLVVKCPLRDAEIWLDSRYFREVSEASRGVRLSAGKHRLEVRHPDYHSMYYEIDMQAQERKVLEVNLAKRLH